MGYQGITTENEVTCSEQEKEEQSEQL